MDKLGQLRFRSSLEYFKKWELHYRPELRTMYEKYMDPDLSISYEDFAYTAFLCSKLEFNTREFKHTPPLI